MKKSQLEPSIFFFVYGASYKERTNKGAKEKIVDQDMSAFLDDNDD